MGFPQFRGNCESSQDKFLFDWTQMNSQECDLQWILTTVRSKSSVLHMKLNIFQLKFEWIMTWIDCLLTRFRSFFIKLNDSNEGMKSPDCFCLHSRISLFLISSSAQRLTHFMTKLPKKKTFNRHRGWLNYDDKFMFNICFFLHRFE